MKTFKCSTSACQFCRYYQLEGRRGGTCQQLGVPVKANWKACSLALPPFAPSWESFEQIWLDDKRLLREDLATTCSQRHSQPTPSTKVQASNPENVATKVALV
ncbi:MAG: hypothetical protein RIG63_12020 [Coleofasciculus chthonoplastes F3-SA18-01]|uniref:hypothetical protein n=1 Tax=Coleofasciculus chthonoplastes TaxID=64178 RepID=UPI0032F5EB22